MPEAWTRRVWIIDGHNAIFSIPEFAALQEEGKKAQARGRLAAWLQGFASRLSEPLTIVFDGRRECGVPDPEPPFLRILFSHPPEEADDRIVMLAQAAVRAGRGVAVVSNDRRSLMPRRPSAAIALGVEEFRQRYIDRPLPRPVKEKSL
ncbi:MAG: NYN domain-containing protein, partial [Candidatus Eisenbacteria bacterium]